jgi:hypothetical protein
MNNPLAALTGQFLKERTCLNKETSRPATLVRYQVVEELQGCRD